MSGRLAAAPVLLLLMLVAAPAAGGDGPMPLVMQGGAGVLTHDGKTRYVTVALGEETALESIETNGVVRNVANFPGSWGIPVTTSWGSTGDGLTPDGRTLVLGDIPNTFPRTKSSFLVLDPTRMRRIATFWLKGDFSYDAISPDGKRLYLIQHVDATRTQRYVVRAYDVEALRLLPGRIADRTQTSWVMQGYPMARATSADGRWVYTLYQNPGGYPFVHALDTVNAVAHCIGLPWRGSQDGFYNLRLSLRDEERTLAVHWLSGRPFYRIDTATWKVARDSRGGVPWLWVGIGAAAAAGGVGAALLLRRRRRREKELEQELADLLGVPEREVVV